MKYVKRERERMVKAFCKNLKWSTVKVLRWNQKHQKENRWTRKEHTCTRKEKHSRKPAFNLIAQWVHVVSPYWQCISTNCTHYFNFPVGCIDFMFFSQSFICSYIPPRPQPPPPSDHLSTDMYVHGISHHIWWKFPFFHNKQTYSSMQNDAWAHRLTLIVLCTRTCGASASFKIELIFRLYAVFIAY